MFLIKCTRFWPLGHLYRSVLLHAFLCSELFFGFIILKPAFIVDLYIYGIELLLVSDFYVCLFLKQSREQIIYTTLSRKVEKHRNVITIRV